MKNFVWSVLLSAIALTISINAQSSRRPFTMSGAQLRGELVGMERHLPNGNIVVIDTLYSEPGAKAIGVVRLYDASKTSLISELKGSTANDRIGSDGVEVLPDGNFLVHSPTWNGGQIGAITFCRADIGCNGFVSSANSQIGGQSNQPLKQKKTQVATLPAVDGPAVVDFVTGLTAYSIAGATRTYMGESYNLGSTTNLTISTADVLLGSVVAANYTNVQVNVRFWGAADLTATPVFSAPLATYTYNLGGLNSTANSIYDVNLTLPSSGLTLPSATNQGIAFNFKGDTGSGLADTDNLTTIVRGGANAPAFAVGSVAGFAAPNFGYFRNASARTDFNFIPGDARNIGANSSLAFILYNPVAAQSAASISGRVATSTGRGISKTFVILTDSTGRTRYALTNPFGYYRFSEVATGANYVVSVVSKRYTFAPQNVTLSGDLADLNFVAQ